MNCYICNGHADSIQSTGDYEHLVCKSCGEYQISGTAVAMVETNNLRTGDVLKKIQQAQGRGEIYQISSLDFF